MNVAQLIIGSDEAPSPADLVRAVERLDTEAVWLLAAGAHPLEGALEALRAHPGEITVSLPVDAAGEPVEGLIGRAASEDTAALLEAVRGRTLPLRHTAVVSLLAPRERLLAHAPPDVDRYGRWAGTEWTARLFAERPGLLVPASRVVAPPLGAPLPASFARTARRGVWGRGETLREAARALRGGGR